MTLVENAVTMADKEPQVEDAMVAQEEDGNDEVGHLLLPQHGMR
jgi:hypothetical protein